MKGDLREVLPFPYSVPNNNDNGTSKYIHNDNGTSNDNDNDHCTENDTSTENGNDTDTDTWHMTLSLDSNGYPNICQTETVTDRNLQTYNVLQNFCYDSYLCPDVSKKPRTLRIQCLGKRQDPLFPCILQACTTFPKA